MWISEHWRRSGGRCVRLCVIVKLCWGGLSEYLWFIKSSCNIFSSVRAELQRHIRWQSDSSSEGVTNLSGICQSVGIMWMQMARRNTGEKTCSSDWSTASHLHKAQSREMCIKLKSRIKWLNMLMTTPQPWLCINAANYCLHNILEEMLLGLIKLKLDNLEKSVVVCAVPN